MSNFLHKSTRVFIYQFKREFLTPKTRTIFIILAIYLFSILHPVTEFSKSVGISVTPWFFPLVTSDFLCQIFFIAGAIYFFSHAPFRNSNQLYVLHRSGRLSWQMGNIMFLICASFLYTLFLLLVGVLCLSGHLDFDLSWGKIWGTLARTTAGYQFNIPFIVEDFILGVYSPVEATIIGFLLEWFCVLWIGLVIYVINSIFKKNIGTIVAILFLFLDVMIYNSWTPSMYKFSPVTLSQLANFSGNKIMCGISQNYAFNFFAISFIVLVGIIMFLSTKKVRRRILKNEP